LHGTIRRGLFIRLAEAEPNFKVIKMACNQAMQNSFLITSIEVKNAH